jgi:hypothetical protein
MCDGFIVHTAAPVGELELPALNKRPNLGLDGIALLIPPAREYAISTYVNLRVESCSRLCTTLSMLIT